jgi:RNA recognition motif-containing protein
MNLYIKNLDAHITNDDLSQVFRKYGRIISARVMTNQTGQSKGYGFVSFAKPEEAAAALQEMNGYILANRPLTVSYHEPKKKLTPSNNSSSNNNTMTTTRSIIYDKPNTNGKLIFIVIIISINHYNKDIVGLGIVDQLGMRDLSIGQRSPPKKVNSPIYPPYAATAIVRRNSNESVMTEATAKIQRIKLDSAVRRCGHYGRMTEEIVDMLMTLKRKERSLCLFNQEYLREKAQLAVDALTTCDDEDDVMDYKR